MDNILYIFYPITGLLMIALGIGLGIFLTRRFNLGWRLWWIGGVTFILSQVGHIPFNLGITALFQNGYLPAPPKSAQLYVNAIFLGVSSGIWEEFARFFMYRWWAKDARSWKKALLAGAGHGGSEAIILGALVLLTFFQMLAYRSVDISTMVPAEQLASAQANIQAYWTAPWYQVLLGAIERVFALCLHLANSVIVLQVFTRRQFRWVWLAVAWHAIFNAVAVVANSTLGPYITEGLIGIGALISVLIIFTLRNEENLDIIESSPEPIKPLELHQVDEVQEDLESSRYHSL